MAHALASKTAFSAKTVSASKPRRVSRAATVVRAQADVQAQDLSRRNLLGLVAGLTAGAVVVPQESLAAYGDSANVFGKVTNKSGFVPYAGEGYALLLPSTWGPSKEREYPNVELRYEDNTFPVNNLVVIKEKTDKKSIEDFGTPEAYLSKIGYLFGKQAYEGKTESEGGFAPNKVSAASLLGVEAVTDKKGNKFYKYDVLVRTADGDEGGRHQLIAATVGKDGFMYLLKVQVGDKRWIRGVKKDAVGAINSFTIA